MKILLRAVLALLIFGVAPTGGFSQESKSQAEQVCSEFVSLYRKGEFEQAEAVLRNGIETERSRQNPERENLLPFYRNLITVLRKQNKLEQVGEINEEIKRIEFGMALTRSSVKADSTRRLSPEEDNSDYLQFTSLRNRWPDSRMPLKVFMKNGDGVPGFQPHYSGILKQSFAEWTEASNGKITFEFVDEASKAAIECSWAEKSEGAHSGITATVPKKAGELAESHIRIFTYHTQGQRYANEKQVRSSCLHEIGHALGISGHSDRSSDIMYPISMVQSISPRDKRTLEALYSVPEGKSDEPEKQKQMTPSDESIWVPSTVSSMVREGTEALNSRNSKLAIEKSKKALELAPNYVFAKRTLACAYSSLASENWHQPAYALYLLHRSYFTDARPETQKNMNTLIRNMGLNPNDFDVRVKLAKAAAENSDDFGAIVEYEAALQIKASPEIEKKLKAIKRPPLLSPEKDPSTVALKEIVKEATRAGQELHSPIVRSNSESFTYDVEPANLNNQGVAAMHSGNNLLAAEKFVAALKKSPTYQIARRNLSTAYNNLGIYAAANPREELQYFHLSSFVEATVTTGRNMDSAILKLGMNPRSFVDREKMGDEAFSKGDRVGAIVEYSEALKIKDDDAVKKKLADIPVPSIPNEIELPTSTLGTRPSQPSPSLGVLPKQKVSATPIHKNNQSPPELITRTKTQTATVSGTWRGTIHVDSADFEATMEFNQQGLVVSGSIICSGGDSISKHYFRGTFDAKNAQYTCKDIGVEKLSGSAGWFPTAVDQYSIHLVENNTKLVGSCIQGKLKSWFSLKR